MGFNLDDRETSKTFAAYLQNLEARLSALEGSNPLTNASIESGSLDIYDDDGTLRASLGMQSDGTVALVPVNSEPPPTPTAPTVEPTLAGLVVTWDGTWADSDITPADYATLQIHVSGAGADYEPDLSTLASTISAPLGGSATVAVDGYAPVWVRLVATNTAALTGPPSEATESAARQAVPPDLIDGIVTEVKLAEDAVTAAKIALGAVGSIALADGAVLEDKLAKAAVTLGKIADGAVNMNALGGALADGVTQRYIDAMGDPATWAVLAKPAAAAWEFIDSVPDAPTGRTVARATGYAVVRGTVQVPYDPDVLYRISARVRTTASSSAGTDTLYVGALGIAADGVTLVSRTGANSSNSAHYIAASNAAQPVASGWVTYVGYLRGRAATGVSGTAVPAPDARTPGVMHASTRFISPILYLNFAGGTTGTTGVMEVDAFTIEVLKTGIVDSTNLVVGSVTTAALATDSVTAGKVAADAIGARELQANSVTAQEIAAGSVTTDKLTVAGGLNQLSDPSFEGAYTGLLVASQTYWSQASGGNNSSYALRLDCTATAATTRNLRLTTVPVLAGDQLYLAVDYNASTTWVGSDCRMFARWYDGSGAHLSTSSVVQVPAARAVWEREAVTVTAPPGAVQAQIWIEGNAGRAGTLLWDNAVVRPLVPGVQIADGAITAPKILAGAITTDKLVALAVTAEKIAALAITTDKLAALSVTADQLAANAVTATKIAAGAIEATHIKAGAITAEKIDADALNGKTITGAIVRTAALGDRVELTNSGTTGLLRFFNSANRLSAAISSSVDDEGMQAFSVLGPDPAGTNWGGRPRMLLSADGAKSTAQLNADKVVIGSASPLWNAAGTVQVVGYLNANNIATGRVRITPTPNVPTSMTVTGLGLPRNASSIYAVATPYTTVPGTSVTGVGITDPTPMTLTVWLTRSNNSLTSVDYIAIATG
ncbi:hypothetical protein ABZV52_29640 [Streptomyces sp. NPDC004735]|uniref:hypothetical protein n=1 Tax=Streptomyces sp. NPDC004735 TaxID=3156654 RepID=UPI0033B99E63